MATSSRPRVRALGVVVVALGLLFGAEPAWAQDDVVVAAGVNVRFVTGTFGSDQTTNVVYAPASVRVEKGRFEFSASFPFVSVRDGTVLWSQGGFVPMQGTMTGAPGVGVPMGGPGGMMGGMMGGAFQPQSPSPGSPATGTPALITSSGFGDIIAGAGYRIVDRADGLQVVVNARVKLPTASSVNGLGTGETDVAGGVSVRRRLSGGWIYADGGFIAVGDPAGVTLNNAVLWAVGGGKRLSSRVYLLASAYGNSPTVAGFGAPVELSAGLGFPLTARINLTVTPIFGFTNASPKYGVVIGLTSDMTRR